MKLVTLFGLALKLTRREWRSGELSILVVALVIAVAGTTAISLLGHRLTRTMEVRAAEFLAADLVVGAHEPLPSAWLDEAKQRTLNTAEIVEFSSVLVEHEELLLAGIKAVSDGYPLRGELRYSESDLAQEHPSNHGPQIGTAWVESRILNTLHLALGDSITVGEKSLKIVALLTHEPDRRGNFFSLSPRLLMNLSDLPATRVIQPGSNAHYYAMVAGEEDEIRAFKSWLKPQLHPGQNLLDIHEDRPELGNAITRAERYLGLSSIVIVLIAGVAVAMSAGRYTERHFDLTAMLKCLGASHREVLFIYLLQFLAIGIIGSFLGCLLGYAAQEAVLALLHRLLPQALSPPAWYAPLFGGAVGLVMLIGFALPPILKLGRLSPLRVIRRDLLPLPSSAWLVYGLAMLCLSVLLWRYTEDGRMTAMVLAIGAAALLVVGFLALGLLRLCRNRLRALPFAWRFGLQNMTRHPRLGVAQLMAFSLTLAAMQLSWVVRSELLQEWRNNLPENAPNHFALNLFETDLAAFQKTMEQAQLQASAYYPIIRGRLTGVNGRDVQKIPRKNTQGEAAIHRDLSLTFTAKLPRDNHIVEGKWWEAKTEQPRVSVEKKLAEDLHIEPGDRLSFSLGSQTLVAEVASLRSVRWDSMTPNFYMIFQPGDLEGFPRTYLTSFYLATTQKGVLASLAKAFPAVTLLEVDALLRQIQSILHEVSLAIEFVLVLALAAGFTVLFAAVQLSLDERLREDCLLRAMGASRGLLRKSQWLEFAFLGLLSGILGYAMAELLGWVLFTQVFDLSTRLHWELWLITPAIGTVSVALFGFVATRKVLDTSPWQLLREL